MRLQRARREVQRAVRQIVGVAPDGHALAERAEQRADLLGAREADARRRRGARAPRGRPCRDRAARPRARAPSKDAALRRQAEQPGRAPVPGTPSDRSSTRDGRARSWAPRAPGPRPSRRGGARRTPASARHEQRKQRARRASAHLEAVVSTRRPAWGVGVVGAVAAARARGGCCARRRGARCRGLRARLHVPGVRPLREAVDDFLVRALRRCRGRRSPTACPPRRAAPAGTTG